MAPQQLFGSMNMNNQPANYGEGTYVGMVSWGNPPIFNCGNPPPIHIPQHMDGKIIREVMQELYGPGLRQIDRPEFHKSY